MKREDLEASCRVNHGDLTERELNDAAASYEVEQRGLGEALDHDA